MTRSQARRFVPRAAVACHSDELARRSIRGIHNPGGSLGTTGRRSPRDDKGTVRSFVRPRLPVIPRSLVSPGDEESAIPADAWDPSDRSPSG